MSGRAPRLAPAERRTQILDAALELAGREGFHAVTIDGVAKAAGITRPVVYDLFGDLEGLLASLADREEARALAALARVIPEQPGASDDPDTLLAGGLEGLLEAVHREPATWRLVLLPPAGTPPELRERIADNRDRIRARLVELLSWGLDKRGGPAVEDAELLAHMLVVVAEDAARLTLTHPRRHPPARFGAFARDVLAALPPSP